MSTMFGGYQYTLLFFITLWPFLRKGFSQLILETGIALSDDSYLLNKKTHMSKCFSKKLTNGISIGRLAITLPEKVPELSVI